MTKTRDELFLELAALDAECFTGDTIGCVDRRNALAWQICGMFLADDLGDARARLAQGPRP